MIDDWTDPQRAVIERVLDRTYDRFVELVAKGRGMSTEEVDAIGQGRVFTGAQGATNGLVDVLGDFEQALAEARELAGLEPGAKIQLLDFPKPVPWWRQFSGRRSREDETVHRLLAGLEDLLHSGVIQNPGLVWMPPIRVE
jgi:ClpP class serine protease